MHTLITNARGTRSIAVSDEHIDTLRRYHLLDGLVGSGTVTEDTLERLRLHTRALLEQAHEDNALIALCHDVIFHDNMKATGLANLIDLCQQSTDNGQHDQT